MYGMPLWCGRWCMANHHEAAARVPPMPRQEGEPVRPGVTAPPSRCELLLHGGLRLLGGVAFNRWEGTLIMVFEATCTSRTGKPCKSLPQQYVPTTEEPIDVTWVWDFPIHLTKVPAETPDAHDGGGSESPP
jgi:hypothetical protein